MKFAVGQKDRKKVRVVALSAFSSVFGGRNESIYIWSCQISRFTCCCLFKKSKIGTDLIDVETFPIEWIKKKWSKNKCEERGKACFVRKVRTRARFWSRWGREGSSKPENQKFDFRAFTEISFHHQNACAPPWTVSMHAHGPAPPIARAKVKRKLAENWADVRKRGSDKNWNSHVFHWLGQWDKMR